jgi:peptidoglycan/LPS O-acetylase OafA/YrhL
MSIEPPSIASGKTEHIKGIDGLRALSVIAVVLFHQEFVAWGWIGVWLFFAISGFVITLSITGIDGTWTQRLGTFYARRALRILPPYLLLVVIGAALGVLTHKAWLVQSVPWLLTGTYNIFRMFPDHVKTRLFDHLWSLSIEEQFYLLYPLAFFLIPRRAVLAVLGACIVVAPLVRYGFGQFAMTRSLDPGVAVYFFGPGHFDAFAAGCLLALTRFRSPWFAIPALAAGLAYGIFVGYRAEAFGNLAEVVTYSTLALASTGVLAATLRFEALAVALDNPVLRWIGRRSYGIYLFHFPLSRAFAGFKVGFPLYCCALAAVTVVSWRFLEQPIQRWGRRARVERQVMPAT